MELLFVLILILLVVSKNNLKNIKQEYKPAVILEKKCPPHKWRYEDIKDQEGTIQSTRIVCDNCGPLKSLSTPERMDY